MDVRDDARHSGDGESLRTRVAICAATCRRPDGLRRLLNGLAQLQFDDASRPEINVIIVDNDPAGSAREIVEAMRANVPWPIAYVHEKTPGIPFARNAALDAVSGDCDFVCFIDDDETPHPNWLAKLLRVQKSEGADVVAGPVVPEYDNDVPSWVKRGGFFDRPRRPTGTSMKTAFTGNVLFRAELPKKHSVRFDTRFAGTFGEDYCFFAQLHAAGTRMVWADDAVVVEQLPAARVKARVLIRRMYEIGRSMATISAMLNRSFATPLISIAKGVVWILIGCITLPAGLFARRWAVRSLRWLAYGIGLLHGVFQPLRSASER